MIKVNRVVFTVNEHEVDNHYVHMRLRHDYNSLDNTETQVALTFHAKLYNKVRDLSLLVKREPGQRFIFPTIGLVKKISKFLEKEFGDTDLKLIETTLQQFVAKMERVWLVEAVETQLLEDVLPTFESGVTEDSYVATVLADTNVKDRLAVDIKLVSNKKVNINLSVDVEFPLFESLRLRLSRMHSAIALGLADAHPLNASRSDGVNISDYLNLVSFITNHVMLKFNK